uniref:Sulfotransferase domain-containing protein n=1 Tax=Amphora coffeiformis TaxID=265554 RepID=A0A7S3P696_9STRA|mmetsp:Transcript_11347/g.21650  ORF Transcript_11347/g.21650 Transcript_11347/m.21650 type:complete len:465 (+) Transcript_11347:153-1547(+)|eukprot:scaffold19245_cov199-Amphora_coffeaeformis.AAC.22
MMSSRPSYYYPDSSISSFVARYGLAVVLWIWVFYVFGGGIASMMNNNNNKSVQEDKGDTVPSLPKEPQQGYHHHDHQSPASSSIPSSAVEEYDSYDRPICLDTLTPQTCPHVFADEWMSPKAIIIGTQKGGTRALLHYLGDHPDSFTWQGAESKILIHTDYMYDHHDDDDNNDNNNDDKNNDNIANHHDYNDTNLVVDPCHVRKVYHELFLAKQGNRYNPTTPASQQPFMFDKSPSYMLHAEIVPQRLTCAFPLPQITNTTNITNYNHNHNNNNQLKIIILLRNPTDRSFSHYHHGDDKKNGPRSESFRSMVEREITLLQTLGLDDLVKAGTSTTAQATFWKRYKATAPPKESLIARSLYVLQLRQWLGVFHHAYNNGDANLRDTVLILESERLHTDTQTVLDQVLDFLDMTPYTFPVTADHHAHPYQPMDADTRQYLDNFFRPWNDQLRDLLQPYGVTLSWAS